MAQYFCVVFCSFPGRRSTLETSIVILRGRRSTSDVSHCVLYTLHSVLYTPHSTLYTSHSTLHIPHFTLYTLHSTLYTPHSTLHTLHSTLHTSHSTLHILHFTLYTQHFTLHTPHSTLYTPHSTLYTPHFTSWHSCLHIVTFVSAHRVESRFVWQARYLCEVSRRDLHASWLAHHFERDHFHCLPGRRIILDKSSCVFLLNRVSESVP